MILRSLYDYYHRLQAMDGSLPKPGFKSQEIPFIIVIDDNGKFIRIEDRRINKKESQKFYVLNESRSGTGFNPYPFYDNVDYLIGCIGESEDIKIKMKHNAFINRCASLSNKYSSNKCFKAIVNFYETKQESTLCKDPLWIDLINKPGAILSFLLQGDTEIAASKKELENEIALSTSVTDEHDPICLITGEKAPSVKTTTASMIPGSQATAKLVAFQVNSGYDSYGKQQGSNAPISFEGEASYTSALLKLLSKDSRNKFYVGNRTFIFWTSSQSEASLKIEESIYSFLGFSELDDPNKNIEDIRSAFNSIYSGKLPSSNHDKFYILGLAPNSARIAVVYWNEVSVQEFAKNMLRHFEDMEIIDNRKEKNLSYIGIRNILSTVTLGGKQSDVQPNLPEQLLRSVIQGSHYPYSLYCSALRRIRAEQKDPLRIGRIAILKAYLNRTNNNPNNKLNFMLDKSNTNIGYICGRLFAVIEYAQKRANNINTLRERYMNSASATPAAVFSTLLNLSTYHVEKLDERTRLFIEKMKGQIISMLPAEGFPSHLNIQDQGRFFVGYYQQIEDIYTPKEKEITQENN